MHCSFVTLILEMAAALDENLADAPYDLYGPIFDRINPSRALRDISNAKSCTCDHCTGSDHSFVHFWQNGDYSSRLEGLCLDISISPEFQKQSIYGMVNRFIFTFMHRMLRILKTNPHNRPEVSMYRINQVGVMVLDSIFCQWAKQRLAEPVEIKDLRRLFDNDYCPLKYPNQQVYPPIDRAFTEFEDIIYSLQRYGYIPSSLIGLHTPRRSSRIPQDTQLLDIISILDL